MKSFQNEKCRRDVNIPYLNKDAFGVAKRAAILGNCNCSTWAIDEVIPSQLRGNSSPKPFSGLIRLSRARVRVIWPDVGGLALLEPEPFLERRAAAA